MSDYQAVCQGLVATKSAWLIFGVISFIGFNFLEYLVKLNQHLAGMGNFVTGYQISSVRVVGALPNTRRSQESGAIRVLIPTPIAARNPAMRIVGQAHQNTHRLIHWLQWRKL